MKKRGRKRIEGADHRTSFLKSVERTLDALEILSQNRLVGIAELADIMRISTSTAHRILATLEKKGFAVQDLDTEKYTVGHMVFQLARSAIQIIEPLKYIRPHLYELCKKTGESVVFGVVAPRKDKILVLAEEIADKQVIVKSVLFRYFPIHVCPCGKAYLLTLNDKQIRALLSEAGMERFTKYTITSLAALKKQLTKFRKLGYAISRDEFAVGVSAIGSGIRDAEDKFIGAITVIGPSSNFADKNIIYWKKLLLQATAELDLEFKTRGIA